MIVVDCTVVADFWVGDSDSKNAAQNLWKRDSKWIAPALWRYEFGNVLIKYVKAGRISRNAMNRYLSEGEGLISETVASLNLSEVAELSLCRDISYYDASYVWLAQSRDLPLYTRDGRLLKKCEGLASPLS